MTTLRNAARLLTTVALAALLLAPSASADGITEQIHGTSNASNALLACLTQISIAISLIGDLYHCSSNFLACLTQISIAISLIGDLYHCSTMSIDAEGGDRTMDGFNGSPTP